jgi:hypothetical protein
MNLASALDADRRPIGPPVHTRVRKRPTLCSAMLGSVDSFRLLPCIAMHVSPQGSKDRHSTVIFGELQQEELFGTVSFLELGHKAMEAKKSLA